MIARMICSATFQLVDKEGDIFVYPFHEVESIQIHEDGGLVSFREHEVLDPDEHEFDIAIDRKGDAFILADAWDRFLATGTALYEEPPNHPDTVSFGSVFLGCGHGGSPVSTR